MRRRRRNGGRRDCKERELEKNYRILFLNSKERLFPLLEFVKMLLAHPECPNYKEEGGNINLNWGLKTTAASRYLSSP